MPCATPRSRTPSLRVRGCAVRFDFEHVFDLSEMSETDVRSRAGAEVVSDRNNMTRMGEARNNMTRMGDPEYDSDGRSGT